MFRAYGAGQHGMSGPVGVLPNTNLGMSRALRDGAAQQRLQNGSLAIRRASLEDAALLTSLSAKPPVPRQHSASTSAMVIPGPAKVSSAPLMAEITEILRPRSRKRKLVSPVPGTVANLSAVGTTQNASSATPVTTAAAAALSHPEFDQSDPEPKLAFGAAGGGVSRRLPAVIRDFVKKEGNRIAAKRCREKKKLYIEALQQRVCRSRSPSQHAALHTC